MKKEKECMDIDWISFSLSKSLNERLVKLELDGQKRERTFHLVNSTNEKRFLEKKNYIKNKTVRGKRF